MTTRKFDIDEVRRYIENTSDHSRIYIGADSCRFRKNGVWYAEYTVAIVVHIDGSRGCKVFGTKDTERDYDGRKDRPVGRLMNEVYRAVGMYLELQEAIGDRKFEIHLDINPDVMHGSNHAMQQAIGYVRGMTNVIPLIKPDAFAASYAADRLDEIGVAREKVA